MEPWLASNSAAGTAGGWLLQADDDFKNSRRMILFCIDKLPLKKKQTGFCLMIPEEQAETETGKADSSQSSKAANDPCCLIIEKYGNPA